jgi:hypothetical protein
LRGIDKIFVMARFHFLIKTYPHANGFLECIIQKVMAFALVNAAISND